MSADSKYVNVRATLLFAIADPLSKFQLRLERALRRLELRFWVFRILISRPVLRIEPCVLRLASSIWKRRKLVLLRFTSVPVWMLSVQSVHRFCAPGSAHYCTIGPNVTVLPCNCYTILRTPPSVTHATIPTSSCSMTRYWSPSDLGAIANAD